MDSLRSLLIQIGALALILGAFLLLTHSDILSRLPKKGASAPQNQTASVVSSATTSAQATSSSVVATTTPKKKPIATKPVAQKVASDQAVRINNPYPFPQESSTELNDDARGALVNILCLPRSGGLRPISGSGVIIDSRGVILTNAHVAQYVLLSESPRIDLSCTIRAGSPAVARFAARVLYIPPAWVELHASEINNQHPLGTGEHDYALLLISQSTDGSPLPSSFPSVPFDVREAIGFQGDSVLVASYPAEFSGGMMTQFNLFAASSFTSIRQLLTFQSGTVDLISLGGIIEAQSGSSGGAVLNMWGRLIGLIATTSEGDTTASRDLRALTLSYISRDLATQTQFDLPTTLGGDVQAEADDFGAQTAPRLINLFIDQLSR